MRLRVVAALLLLNGTALWGKTPGAAFLSIAPSVRSRALGRVSTAALGAQSLGENPALLSPVQAKSEFYASFAQRWDESNDAHVAIASALGPRRSWGLSATGMDSGDSPGRDLLGQPTGETNPTRHGTAAGAFSQEFSPGLRAGGAGRLIRSTLAGHDSGITWAVDVGISAKFKKFLWSVSANQLGPGIRYIDQRDPLPGVLRLDGSWESGPATLLAGVHRSLVNSESEAATGFEYRIRALSLRAGVRVPWGGPTDWAGKAQSTANTILDDLTAGFGLRLGNNLRMDYAFSQSAPDWGADHAMALTWSWGTPPAPPPKVKSAKTPQRNSIAPAKTKPVPARLKLGK